MSAFLFRLRGLALLALLAACQGGTDAPTLQLQVIDAARESITAKLAPKSERPPVTRAVLDTLDGAFLEITREREDLTAFLFPTPVRGAGTADEIIVWRTETDETVTLRGGVLIATRGLGGDVLSSEVQLRPGGLGPASGQRVLHVADKDNKQLTLPLACDVVDRGPARIEIIGWSLPTHHVQERCEGGGGTVVNDYWVDAGNGLVWQSRQWAGPHIGYLRLRQVTR
ncbi:YjbF family lipoprotein [Rhodobacteraceae bacterium F11138]|nr:YjbF family lipoprotein [Rhodobacteraceae bacterium F11138]